MHACRNAAAKRSTGKRKVDALLVHRMTRLMQRGEQRVAEITLVDARGDAHIAVGELCTERMVRQVKTAARKIVTQLCGGISGKFQLARLGKLLMQAGIVRLGLVTDRVNKRQKSALEFTE